MKRLGLIGERLEHSYSAKLHRFLGNAPYELFPLPPGELDAFLRKGEFDGLNVTIPYKQSVVPYCAALSETAARTGSVNTLVKRPDGTLYGDNTDAYGFAQMAKGAGIDFAGTKTLVLGSGGTSRTVCAVVREAGGIPVVVSRQGPVKYEDLSLHADAAVVVNTTPVGMYPHTAMAPLDLRQFPKLTGVLDVIYNPLRTRLIQQAMVLAIPCAGGLPMLVWQAARASPLFQGRPLRKEQLQAAFASFSKEVTNLVLVGMPGSGKTTVGRRVAEMLHLPLVDIDAEIERRVGRSLETFIHTQGEAAFRELESAQIQQYGKQGGRVLVTGGGAVLSSANRESLRLNSLVVQLTRPVALLAREGRPLSKDLDALQALWQQRAPLYAACADVVMENVETPERCAMAVKEAYDEALCD